MIVQNVVDARVRVRHNFSGHVNVYGHFHVPKPLMCA